MRYVIDKIDGGWAYLEPENGRFFDVPVTWLPTNAREGDVLEWTRRDSGQGVTELEIRIDQAETQEQRDKNRRLRDSIPRGPEGDIKL